MKKVILSAVAASFLLASCGPDICDCMDTFKKMGEELKEANGDEAKMKEIEEKYKGDIEACKKLDEGKSDEEKKKMMEEAEKCGK
ncbi:MAG: hypothetical protein KDC84_07930 [Crocinitomicaceae bacterium]|nr:hypothetical protein [Crocinitomicaceae bacterium]